VDASCFYDQDATYARQMRMQSLGTAKTLRHALPVATRTQEAPKATHSGTGRPDLLAAASPATEVPLRPHLGLERKSKSFVGLEESCLALQQGRLLQSI